MIACKMGYERKFLTPHKLNDLNALILLKTNGKICIFLNIKH
jgi:hypothetical protein